MTSHMRCTTSPWWGSHQSPSTTHMPMTIHSHAPISPPSITGPPSSIPTVPLCPSLVPSPCDTCPHLCLFPHQHSYSCLSLPIHTLPHALPPTRAPPPIHISHLPSFVWQFVFMGRFFMISSIINNMYNPFIKLVI